MTEQKKTRRPRRMAREAKADVPAQQVQDTTIEPDQPSGSAPTPSATKRRSKAAMVLELLQRPEGAMLDEMVEATGWLPHTTRAALTGLRKKGHAVISEKADGVRRYRVAEEVSA